MIRRWGQTPTAETRSESYQQSLVRTITQWHAENDGNSVNFYTFAKGGNKEPFQGSLTAVSSSITKMRCIAVNHCSGRGPPKFRLLALHLIVSGGGFVVFAAVFADWAG
jgi:hypothetical protein